MIIVVRIKAKDWEIQSDLGRKSRKRNWQESCLSNDMAQTADKIAPTEDPTYPSQVMPTKATLGPYVISQEPALEVLRAPAQSAIEERLDHAKWRASDVLISTKQLIGKVYRNAQERAVDTFTNLASASRYVTRSARTSAEQIRKEHPLQLLAVIGGTALVLGVVARVWRSRRHA